MGWRGRWGGVAGAQEAGLWGQNSPSVSGEGNGLGGKGLQSAQSR